MTQEETTGMRSMVIVDLMAHVRPYAKQVVEAHVAATQSALPLRVVGIQDVATSEGWDWDPSLAEAAGVQVTGSPDMVQDSPWATPLAEALTRAARRGVPVLGVCFGHQMLGVHHGARLASWEGPRVGVADVRFQAAGPFAAETIPVLLTHRDHLIDPGPLRVVASGGMGGIQAWAHPELPMWGVQGHPEADAALARRAEGKDVAHLDDATLDTPAAKAILARFGALVTARIRSPGIGAASGAETLPS